MNLMQAHNQWRTRPPDQCFWTPGDMYLQALLFHHGHDFLTGHSGKYGVKTMHGKYGRLRLEVVEGDKKAKKEMLRRDLIIRPGDHDMALRPTNWAFKRLCYDLNADARFLATCDAEDVASILNKRLARMDQDRQVRLMTHVNGERELLAVTSRDYGWVKNFEVIERVEKHPFFEGWKSPPGRPAREGDPNARPATKADITNKAVSTSGLQVKVGDLIAPASNYLSRESMFMLKVNEDARLEDGSDGGLARGFMISNSEVGKGRLWGLLFDYREICGNLIVWDAKNVLRFSVKHRGHGTKHRGFQAFEKMLQAYSTRKASLDEARIKEAKRRSPIEYAPGTAAKEIEEMAAKFLYGRKLVTLKFATEAVQKAVEYGPQERCDPFSFWGLMNGLTRASQRFPNFDTRLKVDAAAGKLLAMLN